MRKLIVTVLTALTAAASIASASVADAPVFDTARLGDGIVTVSCNSAAGGKLKVMVEKDGKKVYYNLKSDGTPESFPLQFGDGEYRVSVLENVEGTKYRYIEKQNINLDLDDDKKVYLASVQNIYWDKGMNAVKKAAAITEGLKNDSEKITAIYQFIISSITYDKDKLSKLRGDYVPDIDATIASGKGICYDYAATMAAMLRSVGVPTKLVKGYAENIDGYHAWNEIYDPGKGGWITVDATYDAEMKAAGRKFSMEKDSSEYTKVYEY